MVVRVHQLLLLTRLSSSFVCVELNDGDVSENANAFWALNLNWGQKMVFIPELGLVNG
jgi:hypothetical protein